jgi:hypothetical protein
MGCLPGFRCIDAGQAHVHSAVALAHTQGVAITDGEHAGGLHLGEGWHSPCRSKKAQSKELTHRATKRQESAYGAKISIKDSCAMCLSEEGHQDYTRLARGMDDERLRQLDRYYRDELGLAADTAEMELHCIVSRELENRRQERIRRLKRALWLSSRRGRFVEMVKRWLVQLGLWSSARERVIGADTKALRPS